MLARCSRCRSTFLTDRFGVQRCPECGAEVLIRDPSAPPEAPEEATPEGAAPREDVPGSEERPHAEDAGRPPDGGAPRFEAPPPAMRPPLEERDASPRALAPWERGDELGLWRGFFETVRLVLFEPNRFFAGLRFDRTVAPHTYFLLVTVVPMVVGALVQNALEDPQRQAEQLRELADTFGRGSPWLTDAIDRYTKDQQSDSLLGILLGLPLAAFAGLYVWTGIIHLVLLLLGSASGGFLATFKSVVYGSTPNLLALLPGCGAPIAGVWSIVLQVIAISRAHRVSSTTAVLAVLVLPLVLCCGCGLVAAIGGVASAVPGP